jgi:fructose-bisphosphate aldolase, class I
VGDDATVGAMSELHDIAVRMLSEGRGILAADETPGTIGGRFEKLGIPASEETRSAYRELLVTTPGLSQWIGSVILQDETFHQQTSSGTAFPEVVAAQEMVCGIKVDAGAKPLAPRGEEKVTEGLDGLRDRLGAYREGGAQFAKWRAVYTIGDGRPSPAAVHANGHALARYAALCQEAGLVPIVEPEVLLDGDHSLEACAEVTERVLRAVFAELAEQGVDLRGIVLKPNMVSPGSEHAQRASVGEVAAATVDVLMRVLPPAVPGVAFLSGGQGSVEATEHLQAMAELGPVPWTLSFSYGRALQDAPMSTWKGDKARVEEAQAALATRAECNAAAAQGRYTAELEQAA